MARVYQASWPAVHGFHSCHSIATSWPTWFLTNAAIEAAIVEQWCKPLRFITELYTLSSEATSQDAVDYRRVTNISTKPNEPQKCEVRLCADSRCLLGINLYLQRRQKPASQRILRRDQARRTGETHSKKLDEHDRSTSFNT